MQILTGLSTATVSGDAVESYQRMVSGFGVTLEKNEAEKDISLRLAAAIPKEVSAEEGDGLLWYTDSVGHPWRMRFGIDTERIEVVACHLQDEKNKSLIIEHHAWFRMVQRLAITNVHPSNTQIKKEMIRALLRGTWWAKDAGILNCMDNCFKWGPYFFRLRNLEKTNGSSRINLITCFPQRGRKRPKRDKLRDSDGRPARKMFVRRLLTLHSSLVEPLENN